MIVLDSSAMIAFLRGEPGGERVRAVLEDEERDVAVYAHSVNLCEVFYDALKSSDQSTAEAAIIVLKEGGVEERADLDPAFWRDMATLIAAQRAGGGHLALGDAFGLALARREHADFLTPDRHEMEPLAQKGTASITFIR